MLISFIYTTIMQLSCSLSGHNLSFEKFSFNNKDVIREWNLFKRFQDSCEQLVTRFLDWWINRFSNWN